MRRPSFEWVLIMSKGDDVILTENQYQAYKDGWKDGKVFFKDMEVNPSFVVSAFKRDAGFIIEKYPCSSCKGNGIKPRRDHHGLILECTDCGGTGLGI